MTRRLCRIVSLALVASSLPAVATAQEPQAVPPKVVQPDGRIRFAVEADNGMPLVEFLELAEKITGRSIVHHPDEMQNATLRLIGDVQFERGSEEFWSFFQTMLQTAGFACVVRESGDEEVVEVISTNGPRRGELARFAPFVPVDELARYRDQPAVVIVTLVTLEHIDANVATTVTRPFFASTSSGIAQLITGSFGDGRSLLFQGPGSDVHAAVQLIRLADQLSSSGETAHRVVALRHARAVELVPVLRQVLPAASTQSAGGASGMVRVGVEALAGRNLLVLVGSVAGVEFAAGLIEQLDQQSAADGPGEDAPTGAAAPPYRLAFVDDGVEFSLPDGGELSLVQLVGAAQRVTGRTFVYRRAELEGPDRVVSLAGPLRTGREGFLVFVQEVLAVHGLGVEPLGGDPDVLRIRSAD